MMGSTHAMSGAMTAGLAAAAAAFATHLAPWELVLGTAVCAGAAVLPDVDHPNSGVSQTFGPATRGFSFVVRWVSGGHRNGTHSYLGSAVLNLYAFGSLALHIGSLRWLAVGIGISAILVGLGILTAARDTTRGRGAPAYKERWHGRVAVAVSAIVVVVLALAATRFGRAAGTVGLASLLVLTLSATTRITRIRRGSWLAGLLRDLARWDDYLPIPVTITVLCLGFDLRIVPFVVLLGALTHLAGDWVTDGGIPLGWPWSQRMYSLKWFKTDSDFEHGRVFPTCALVFLATLAWNSGLIAAVIS
jgi:membrane-bound metal-dependent hydrolase YbcI (DUF457 family)